MSEKENCDSSKDIDMDSSPEETTSTSESDEKRESSDSPKAGESFLDSPKPFSPFISGHNSPVEGAVGGEVDNASPRVLFPNLNKQAAALDKKRLNSGKLDVFRRFFNQDNMDFYSPSENRRRHRAGRQRHYSDGDEIPFQGRSSDQNPLGHLQVQNIDPDPVLNQAGAIVGVSPEVFELQRIRGSNAPVFPGYGYVEDPEHSIGSAETVPVADAYAGNFTSDISQSHTSSRGVSSESSFPSFPSRTQTDESHIPKIFPLPDGALDGVTRMSPMSTDSDSLPPERPVRQRRFGVSRPISVPARSKSAHAGSSRSSGQTDGMYKSSATGAIPKRKISKDSSIDSVERISSEDEVGKYPELSHSVESDHSLPIPDLNQDQLQNLQRNSEADAVSEDALSRMATSEDTAENSEEESEESSSEQDPASVVSCSSPNATRKSEQRPNEE